jgi:AraC family transcriptional regulator
LGFCLDFRADGDFSYIIESEVTNTDRVPNDMVTKMIPPAEYAVFTAIGKIPDSIQATTKYIHRKWLPKSKYRHADSPEFELDDERSDNSENSEVDIYVPIVTS